MKGKIKGSSFERQIAKKLSLWWSKGETDSCLWRIGSSGAKSKITSSKQLCGDIVQVDTGYQEFPYTCETKFVRSFEFLEILRPEKKGNFILRAIDQCLEDSRRAGKKPMVILKKNYFDEIVIVEKEKEYSVPNIEFSYRGKRFIVLKLKDFLENEK